MSSWRDRAVPVKNDWRSRATPAAKEAEAEALNEMPEWLSMKDRAVVKNFSNSPESSINYLQQQYPGATFKINDGEIEAKQGSEPWRKLDPSGLDLGDVVDLPYDIGAGVAQGLATGAGATLGAAGGPVGAVAGGSAASAGSGALLEALRQKIGSALGIPQDVSGGQVATAGAFGAASPLLFGTGKIAGPAVAKYAWKSGLPMKEAEKALTQGLIGRGWDAAAPKLGEMASGIPAKTIQSYSRNMKQVDELGQKGATEYLQGVADKVQGHIASGKAEAAQALHQALEASGSQVDISKAKSSFLDKIAGLEAQPNLTKADQAEINSLKNAYGEYFGLAQGGGHLPDAIPADRAFDLQKRLKQVAAYEQGMTPADAAMKGSARGGYSAINQGLSDASDGASQAAKDSYRSYIELEDGLQPKFKDAQTTYNTLTGLDTKSKRVLAEKLQTLAKDGQLDLGNDIDVVQAYRAFKDPATADQGKTPLAATTAVLGSLLGYKMGGGYAGAATGAAAGGFVGNAVGGRKMIERTLKANAATNALGEKLFVPQAYDAAVPYAAPSAWELMKSSDQSK